MMLLAAVAFVTFSSDSTASASSDVGSTSPKDSITVSQLDLAQNGQDVQPTEAPTFQPTEWWMSTATAAPTPTAACRKCLAELTGTDQNIIKAIASEFGLRPTTNSTDSDTTSPGGERRLLFFGKGPDDKQAGQERDGSGTKASTDAPTTKDPTDALDWLCDQEQFQCSGDWLYHDISLQALKGTLPQTVVDLTSVGSLSVSGWMSGTLPYSIMEMTGIQSLQIQGFKISGTLPYKVPSSMKNLKLNSAQLSGTIPSFYQNSSLHSLDIGSRLSGSVPLKASFFDVSLPDTLRSLSVNNLDLTGY